MKHSLPLAAALALSLSAFAAAALLPDARASSDPLVSLSYLNGTYRAGLLASVDEAVAAAKKQLSADFSSQLASLGTVQTEVPAAPDNVYETRSMTAGQTALLSPGGELLLVSGSANAASAGLVDATDGAAVASGAALAVNHLYLASASASVQAADSCQILIKP